MTSAEFKTTGNSEEKQAPTKKMCFEWSSNSEFQVEKSGLLLERQAEDHWRHDSQLSWKHHTSWEYQTSMTKFDGKIYTQEGPLRHLPVQVSKAQQGESKNVLYAAV